MESFESIRTASTGNELLAGVDFDFVDSPFERIAPFSNADLGTKSQRLELCRRLRAASRKQTRTKESKGNLEASIGFDRFAELCSGLSELDDKVIDTLHLWTGEAAGIPYFMTFDTTFVNFMTMTSKVKSRCVPVTPSKLFERLRNSDLSSAGQADEN